MRSATVIVALLAAAGDLAAQVHGPRSGRLA